MTEHNLEVIKTAGWVIDLGPMGGGWGGEIVETGMLETERVAAEWLVRTLHPNCKRCMFKT